MDAASWRFIQTELLDLSNAEAAEALGWPRVETGRKFIADIRKGKREPSGLLITAAWLLVFSETRPPWSASLDE